MSVKRLCFLAILTMILTVQEEVLTFIPNFQLTIVLIMVYGAVLGIKEGSLIVLVHVLLDNLLLGTLNLVIMIPMFLGWEILLIIGYLLKKRNLIILTIGSVVGSIIYCYLFAFTNTLFLEVKFYDYLIADIPFQILLVLCAMITMIMFYRIFEKTIVRGLKNFR